MAMSKNEYKRQLVFKIVGCGMLTLIGIAMVIMQYIVDSANSAFTIALAWSFASLFLALTLGYTWILKKQNWFDKQYVRETDERAIHISRRASFLTIIITSVALLIGGYAMSFFQEHAEKAYTMLIVAGGLVTLYSIIYWILSRKN